MSSRFCNGSNKFDNSIEMLHITTLSKNCKQCYTDLLGRKYYISASSSVVTVQQVTIWSFNDVY
jgi:hypothetical protein